MVGTWWRSSSIRRICSTGPGTTSESGSASSRASESAACVQKASARCIASCFYRCFVLFWQHPQQKHPGTLNKNTLKGNDALRSGCSRGWRSWTLRARSRRCSTTSGAGRCAARTDASIGSGSTAGSLPRATSEARPRRWCR